jgi:hypothetical protein
MAGRRIRRFEFRLGEPPGLGSRLFANFILEGNKMMTMRVDTVLRLVMLENMLHNEDSYL